jgi:hypothetical protein
MADKKAGQELNITLKTPQFVGIVLMVVSMMIMKMTPYFELGVVLLIASLILLSYRKYWIFVL